MAIDVECRGCNAKYRVKDELAGRMAECKHCGQKFRVPYRSAVVRLSDEEQLASPLAPPPMRVSSSKSAEPRADRNFIEYGLDPNDPTAPIGKPRKDRRRVQQGLLPDLVLDLWMPLGLMIVLYGIALYTAVNYLLRSNGPLAGFILLFIIVSMFFALVIPMTMRMIEGASKTLDFEAPNAIWLHTASCIALPTMGMTVGLLKGGSIAAMIAGGLIGFVVMIPLMALMFRVDILKGVQAAVLGAMFYVLSLAATGAVLAAVGLWLMPVWKMTRPWDDLPPAETMASAAPALIPEVPREDQFAPAEVAAATPAPTASTPDAAAHAAPAAPVDPWEVAIDAWPGPGRWPGQAHHVLHVRPPVTMLNTAPHEPYAAVVDAEALKVFDLRSGERIGAINERPRDAAAAISRDGAYIAFEVVMTSGAMPPSIEVWSVKDGRMILRVPSNGKVRALGFDPSGRVYVLNSEAGKRVVQGWDVRTRRQVSSTPLDGELDAFAISANARLLAAVSPGQLHVYDLLEAKLAGQRAIEPAFRQVGPVAFSPDGKRLLAAVAADPAAAPRVLVWELADGKMDAPMQLAGAKPGDLSNLDLQWLPDGEGFLCNNEMIDRATSRTIFAPQPLVAFGATGRARLALSNFRVIYEIPPGAQNERLIYRLVSLPAGEILASLKRIRGENWEPAPDVEMPAALAVVSAVLVSDPTTRSAEPATRPLNPATLKVWTVALLAVMAPDRPSLERQLNAAQQKLRPLEGKHRAAEARADGLAGEYIIVRDASGAQQKKRRFSGREIGDAKGAEKRALEEVKDVKIEIARLERELRSVQTARTVTGTLDDDTPVTMFIDNAAHAQLLDPLAPGTKLTVTGGPRFMNGTLEVKVRTVSLAE